MIVNDILKVIYAPHRVFKDIVGNPKYLGIIIVLLLFIGLEVGYEYSQFSGTYTEQTTPTIDQLYAFTNSTQWVGGSNVALTNNFDDFYNYSVYVAGFGLPPTDPNAYYSLYGNSSLQISAQDSNNVMAALSNTTYVDCGNGAFQNLSITLKQVTPNGAPTSVSLSLYSLSDTDYYQYDLTSQLSGTSTIDQWLNLTIPLGPNAGEWTTQGNPTWSNISSLMLDFNYAANSNITIRIGALFFHGEYLTPIQYNSTGILLQFLQLFSLQFIFGWFIFTGLIYLFFKVFKDSVTWKPLFTAVGFAMFIFAIRALVNLAATFTLPSTYYPYDVSLGARFDPYGALYFPTEAATALTAQAQSVFNNIDAATLPFRTIVSTMFLVSYVWFGAVATMAIGALKPEYSIIKRIAMTAIAIVVVIFLLILLVGAI